MASQQAFQQYGHTNKGTLQPGQTISVNKYNVQVERYLSQGGFAHVYLVRTAVPVYNTTHHVLKRIAVANEIMLTEVKKEVDIMRILKGHPNIVHLIDAAWHRMPNGHYEVFILMEFCAGGGIIDMMNRRLRERLTEAEILQIFVDVCEGVAAMHNLRPALLHRDLKVENILQSSPTSFKLCDFGSATAVASKPPLTTQEIRALEADLNRHTTLQYRAPEMVDPYLRRPVDEKSDVWALGVLLYKLCYYTTPFEEHGPLAILNVQYRTPPYPVYSTQMNTLIASMLREHGAQRPSVFEILAHVHRLRGTKSRFAYTIPTPQPLAPSPSSVPANPLENIVAFRPSQNQASVSPSKNAGVQAREKVLEAIAPMRRGRPTVEQTPEPKSRQSSPQKEKAQAQAQAQSKIQSWLDEGFAAEEEKVWRPVKSSQGIPPIRGHRSGAATVDASKVRHPAPPAIDGAWNLEGRGRDTGRDKPKISPGAGFENDFADKLWDSFQGPPKDVSGPATKPAPIPGRPPVVNSDSPGSNKVAAPRKGQDAFEGLGLSASDRPPPQTLGEARKLRTGLTVVNGSNKSNNISPSLSNQASRPPSSSALRPSPSPRPSQYSPAPPRTSSPLKLSPTTAPKPSTSTHSGEVSAEARFPSLEELDATFHTPPLGSTTSQPQLASDKLADLSSPPPRPRMNSNMSGGLRPAGQQSYLKDGVRSEQVTGIAMRESKGTKGEGVQRRPVEENADASVSAHPKRTTTRPMRPSLSRKHRSSISIKHPHQSGNDVLGSPVVTSAGITSPRFPEPKDWLTGNDEGLTSAAATTAKPATETPVLREFTHKRESFIEATSTDIQSPQEVEQLPPLTSSTPTKAKYTISKGSRPLPSTNGTSASKGSPDKTIEQRSPVRSNTIHHHDKTSSSSDDGPEDASGFTSSKGLKRKGSKKRKGRQSSVHDLVDLWGGGVVHLKEKEKEKEKEVVRNPTAGDYKSYTLDTHIKPLTRRPTYIPPSSNPISSSTPSRNSRPQRSPSQHRKQSSATATSDAAQTQTPPSRGRPQSMLIFPMGNSKSDSTTAPSSSPALAPPEDAAPRRPRRTSISDMVQRYEAFGGKSKGPGAVSSPTTAQKPTVLKVATQNTSSGGNARPPRVSPGSRENTTRSGPSLPLPDDGLVAHTRQRTSPTGLPRTSPSGYRESIWTREVENPNAMLRSSPPKSSTISDEPSTPDLQTSQFSSPSWKATTSTEDSSQPSSPERPYQGVGKLIDQWQRKTADAEPDRNLHSRRGGFTGKRPLPGLVGGGLGRSR